MFTAREMVADSFAVDDTFESFHQLNEKTKFHSNYVQLWMRSARIYDGCSCGLQENPKRAAGIKPTNQDSSRVRPALVLYLQRSGIQKERL